MPSVIPEEFLDLFDKHAFAHLATLMPNGQPQVTPVWCDFDGTCVRINSAKERQKDFNMRRELRVALSIQDSENPYRYLEFADRLLRLLNKALMHTSTAWPRSI